MDGCLVGWLAGWLAGYGWLLGSVARSAGQRRSEGAGWGWAPSLDLDLSADPQAGMLRCMLVSRADLGRRL